MSMQGNIEFTIQAKDLSSKTTGEITAALQKLNLAQLATADGAQDATSDASHYEEVQKSLLTVIAELDKRLADASAYKRNGDQLVELQEAIDSTKEKYKDFTARLLEAQTAGNKSVATGAKADLENIGKSLTKLSSEYDAVQRKQAALRDGASKKGVNLADTLGTSNTLQGARAQASSTFDANAAARATAEALALQVAEVANAEAQKTAILERNLVELGKIEAAKRAQYQATQDEQQRITEAARAEQDVYFKQRATQLAEELRLEKQRTDELQRFQNIGAKALSNLSVGQQARSTQNTVTTPTSGTAAAAVTAALDPLAAQTKTLAGLETALGEVDAKMAALGTTAGTTATKVKALKEIQDQLSTVSKGLATQAGLIDGLNRQNAATDAAKEKLAQAEAEVTRLATAIQNATVVDDRMAQSLALAQQRVQGAAQAVQTQTVALDRARASAQAAGINTATLATEEDRLANSARQAGAAQRAASEAIDQANKGATGFAGALDKLSGSGRTSLSFFQRVRGEVLALTASFVGVQAVIGGFSQVLDSVQIDQGINAQIVSIVGAGKAATDQMKFLHDEAVRTSYSMGIVGKSYTTVARQMKEYGLSVDTTNKFLADTLTTTRSMNLSEDQVQQIFLAMGQIFDKTTVQSQELKTQLGNSGLAGVFPNLAKVMADHGIKTVGDLRKEMEKGGVAAAYMTRLMASMAAESKVAFDINLGSYSAQLGNFKTQLYDIELAFAKSGFLKGVTDGLTSLSDALKRPETSEGLRQLGQNLGELIRWIGEVGTNADNLKTGLTILEIYLGGKFALAWTKGALDLGVYAKGLSEVEGAAGSLSGVLGVTSKLGLWGTIIGIGIGLGVLIDKIPGVTEHLDKLADAKYTDLFHRIFDTDGAIFGMDKTIDRLKAINEIQEKIFSAPTRGLGSLFGSIGSDFNGTSERDANLPALQHENELLRQINEQRRKTAAASGQPLVPTAVAPAKTAADGLAPDSPDVAVKLAEQSTQAAIDLTTKLNDAADKKELKTHGDFLALYTKQASDSLKALAKEREDLNKQPMTAAVKSALEANAKAESDLNSAVRSRADADYSKVAMQEGQKRQNQVETFENQRLQAHERTNGLLLAADTQYNKLTEKANDESLAAREETVKSEIAQERQILQKSIDQNNALIAKGKKIGADTSILSSDNSALQSKQARLDIEEKIALALADQKFALEQQDKTESTIQAKLALRAALLDNIQAKLNAHQISPADAIDARRSVDAKTLTGPDGINSMIDGLIASEQKLVDAEAALGHASSDVSIKLQTQIAQLIALKAKTNEATPAVSGLQKEIGDVFAKDANQGFHDIVAEIEKAGQGMESWGEAGKAAGDIILNTIADILEALALYIIKQTILNALQKDQGSSSSGGGSGWGSIVSGAISAWASSKHSGGVVGHGNGQAMQVNPAIFAGARRMHSGGVPGLKNDEYATILKRNEEVLSENNPRNILNGGSSDSTQVAVPGGGTDVHFHADTASFLHAGLNSGKGKKSMYAFFSANKSGISRIL